MRLSLKATKTSRRYIVDGMIGASVVEEPDGTWVVTRAVDGAVRKPSIKHMASADEALAALQAELDAEASVE